MLHDEPDRFRVILHVFDLLQFRIYWNEGRMGPHFHHFSFSTRILRGSYFNWLFKNNGALETPRLEFEQQQRCDAGTVYFISWDKYHCVLAPEDATMSLMVRDRQSYNPGERPDPNYTNDMILCTRDRMLRLLESAPAEVSSRILEI